MTTRGRELLARLRADPSCWAAGVGYQPERNADDDLFDANEDARDAVLVALQYDRRRDDEALLRFLFEQDVIGHERSALQGLDERLTLSAFLLARFRRELDHALMARGKHANFDTECGFAEEFLWIADEPRPAALEKWWQEMERHFPASPELENPLTVASHLAWHGEPAAALGWLERWVAAAQADPSSLAHLTWARGIARDLEGAEVEAAIRDRVMIVAAALAELAAPR